MKIKDRILLLLLLAGFFVPLLFSSAGTIWISISVICGLLMISERGSLCGEKLLLFTQRRFLSSEGALSTGKQHALWLLAGLTAAAFGLRLMFDAGWTDSGCSIGNTVILPTWTMLFYPAAGLVFLRGQKRKMKPQYAAALLAASGAFLMLSFRAGVQTASAGDAAGEIWNCLFTAAICEELFFRAAIYPCAARAFGKPQAVLLSAVLFTLWHTSLVMPLLHHFSGVLLTNLLNVLFLGIVTAVIYECWGLSCSVLFHAVNNGMIIYLIDLIQYA